MSVLINGMEMPKDGTYNIVHIYSDGYVAMPFWGKGMQIVQGVNAVEVVRCKDCRFHEQEQPGMVYCPAVVGGWVDEDWFCKDGERRSE